jgi:hypothetical protein
MLTRQRCSWALAAVLLAGCGHVVQPDLAPNWNGFDFKKPPCPPSPQPEPTADQAAVRYLGAGGLYVEWQGTALLLSPFFSNPGVLRAQFGRLSSDAEAVRRGLGAMDLSRVRAIAAGHSHYDHLADLPGVAETYAPAARIYVNQAGFNALAPLPPLAGRVVSLEGEEGRDWIWLRDADENRMPIRFRKVESEHAPQFFHYRYAAGPIDPAWTEDWQHRHLRDLHAGTTFAFVIDLMSQDLETVRFRMYYQDAANPEGKGLPSFEGMGEHGFDLAVLCMASYQFVRHHPESIIGGLHPRHVLVTHYEDFFRDTRKPVRFVFPLSNGAADRFLRRLNHSMAGPDLQAPDGIVCGPSTPGWTMPMPGEWLRFRVPQAGVDNASDGF